MGLPRVLPDPSDLLHAGDPANPVPFDDCDQRRAAQEEGRHQECRPENARRDDDEVHAALARHAHAFEKARTRVVVAVVVVVVEVVVGTAINSR